MQNWEGIRNKSFTLPGVDGGELTLSETSGRTAIAVSIRCDAGGSEMTTCSVELTKRQFDALCNMNSAYDGLEVREVPKPAGWDDAPEGAVLRAHSDLEHVLSEEPKI